MSPTTAFYSRDEVSGPLGSAPGHEDTQGVYKTIVKKVHEKTTEILENDTPPKGYSWRGLAVDDWIYRMYKVLYCNNRIRTKYVATKVKH